MTRAAAPSVDNARVAPRRRRWWLDGVAIAVAAVVCVAGVAISQHGVSAAEERAFRLVNDLPDALEIPMWVAQLPGVLVVPLVLAALAAVRRHWRLASALALVVPVKLAVEYGLLKSVADRQRPATSICGGDLTCLHLRGVPAAGVSMPSGHAMVAMAAWWILAPHLGRWRWPALALCLLVGVARVYLGAHNPLDVVVGGAAGVGVGAAISLLLGVRRSAVG